MICTRRCPSLLLLLAIGLAFAQANPSSAGCGCDHPPPAFALVMPPFASPGKTISIHPDGFEFVPGESYSVDFGEVQVEVVASLASVLEVAMPDGVAAGPVAIEVTGEGVDHQYAPADFTALEAAPVVPPNGGVWSLQDFSASVSQDGTLLIPFNLSQVVEGTQFAFQMSELPLRYGHDDVVFYNGDGIDLTLFELSVEDPTERQWGSYYGWTVEQDNGILGNVWQRRIRESLSAWFLSDTLTYWRHEFHTYKQAHLPGASHEVGPDGYHVQTGTLHVDHDHLILAVSGKVRDPSAPLDPSKERELEPGSEQGNLFVATVRSDNPIEPDEMENMLHDAIVSGLFQSMLREHRSAYDD